MTRSVFSLSVLTLTCTALLSACDNTQLQAPKPPAFVKDVPSDWAAHKAANKEAIARHIKTHEDDYYGFANFAVSQTDGIPYVILNLLPKLAPEFWGDKDNFLSVMGLFYDPRNGDYPMPRGIGISGTGRADPFSSIDYASFTCGGCHIGRVRLADGSIQYLDGGINAHFNVILYRKKIVQTLNKIYDGETDEKKKQAKVLKAILAALDKVQAEDPNYFYKNYEYDGRQYSAAYEQAQIALFRRDAEKYVNAFIKQQENAYKGWELVSDKNYTEIAERTKDGFAGMEDAIAFNAVHAYLGFKEKWYTAPIAGLAFPEIGAITDIMAIWEQDTRDPLGWNEDQTLLINGGGQWNGHIPMNFYKNLAAQVTLGFENVDPRVSAHAERLLMKLPAPAYPFDVDVALAEKGKKLFAENCADCHQPNNGRVYHDIGTHKGRAIISNNILTIAAQFGFQGDCGPDTEVVLSGKKVKPCAEYKGVSLEGKRDQLMTKPSQHDGYNALPLVGIWAQAPYLHNGSVPTLYHMLMPSERPDSFIKSRLDYDTDKVGFSWDPKVAPHGGKEEGYVYDTASSPVIGHQGHDKDITLDGKTFKLVWEDDREGAKALLEYLKTL